MLNDLKLNNAGGLGMELRLTAKLVVNYKFDIAAKRRKKHKNKITYLIISIGYEAEM
jgi:hypothetical protein